MLLLPIVENEKNKDREASNAINVVARSVICLKCTHSTTISNAYLFLKKGKQDVTECLLNIYRLH
jgi:hypothetical protein